ncbi:beta-lactamase/transpeptidase-like protein [Cercophora newfieldiana]|uniref:Beta-lactamase/transpeptidase-like protein n=1 Tax=Cercophora newfieldiana TaxID=92897 RepID=A0AA40CP02_9PEZI|nr:beta-lactamase/transpeptidase-like protein [Cercophora newfieldiana]
MHTSTLLTLTLVAPLVTSSQPQHPLNPDNAKTTPPSPLDSNLDQFIHNTLTKYKTPGLALAILNSTSTYTKGFGRARQNLSTPVTQYTLFYTGSTTKSFTAAAISQLVDNNATFPHVQWDTPISSLIRDDFVLSDPWATEHITIRDALSHRTGYPAHDFVSWSDPEAATRGLRDLPMSAEPRAKFQYSNQLVTAVGYLITRLYYPGETFRRWPGLLGYVFREKLWYPMGMGFTYLSTQFPGDPSRQFGNALADEFWYHNDSDSHVVVPHAAHAGHEGAGMVISCVADYARFLRHMMSSEGGPISPAGKAAMKAPQMVVSASSPFFTGPLYYGMGWAGGVFEGEEFWFHSGQMREHRTEMWMFPSKKFAVAIMANADTPAIEIVLWKIIYDYFGVPEDRRLDMEERAREKGVASRRDLETCLDRLYPRSLPPLPRPLPLTAYAGVYDNVGYGNVTLSLRCGDEARQGYPAATPAHPTVERGCLLRGSGPLEFEGKSFHVDFEHVTGDYWTGWLFVDDYAPPGSGLTKRPQLCLRAQFQTGPEGTVRAFAGDFRYEGEHGPLVWYEKRKSPTDGE